MAKPLVVEARVATELLKADAAQAAALLGNVGTAAEGVADKLETALGKAGAKFGPWAASADDAVAKVRNSSRDMAREIDKLAGSLAKSMSGQGGDLGAEAARAAADAQKLKLAALNEVEAATLRRIGTDREMTAVEMQYLAALQQAKNETGARLTQLSAEAGALDRLQIELMGAARGHQAVATTSAQNSNALKVLSFQVNDIATGFASGMPPMMIFAQQGSQVVQAFQMMEGGGGKFLSFLGGPWGMGLTAAVTVLLPLIANSELFRDRLAEAVKKLKDQAQATRESDAAQRMFGNTLEGAIAKQRKMNTELEKELSTRQKINKIKVAEAGQGVATAKANLDAARNDPELNSHTISTRVAARQRVKDAETGYLDAQTTERLAQIPNLKLQAAALADPKEAARQRYDTNSASLANKFKLGLLNPSEYISQQSAFDRANAASQKSGPSSATLAKQAEAARVKALGEDTAFAEAERAARHKLLDAMGKTATSEEDRDSLLREDIAAEADATRRKIANDLSAGKITSEEALRLTLLADQAEAQKTINVGLSRYSQSLEDEGRASAASYDRQLAMAQIEASMATTVAARREAELKILALQEARARAAANTVLDNPLSSAADRRGAQDQLNAIDDQHSARVAQIMQQTAGPLDAYRTRLKAASADMQESLQGVAVHGLGSLEDGLVGLISGTESAAGAFKKMAASIIADLARIMIQRMILSAIGGGPLGALFGLKNGGKVPGFAGGGRISGPGTGTSDSILALVGGKNPIMVSNGEAIMNARAVSAYWPLLDAMNKGTLRGYAGGGLVSPRIPSLRGVGGAAPVHQHFTVNAGGSVLANDLYVNLQRLATASATAALAAAPEMSAQYIAEQNSQRIPT